MSQAFFYPLQAPISGHFNPVSRKGSARQTVTLFMNMKLVYNETLGELSSESSKYLFIIISKSISSIGDFFPPRLVSSLKA